MPRRRKIGGSPSRKTGAAAFLPQGDPSLSMSQPAYSVNKEKLFNSMSEMFSDLDPSVVYMVLSECDFKVENAMDCLLELSTHAEGAASSKVSDFESVASSLALVNQRRSVPNQRMWESTVKHCNSEEEEEKVLSPDMPLTEELDSLIENAFQRCSLSVELPNSANDQIVCERDGFKEFPEWEESDLGCNVLLFPHQIATSNEVLENCSSQLPANQLNIQTSSPAASDTFAQALQDSDLSKIGVHQDIASEAYEQSNGETSRGNSDQAQHIVSDHKSATTASGESSQRALELGVAITEEPNSQCLQQHRELMTACDTHNTSLPEACVSLEKSSFKTPKLKDFQQSEQNYGFNLSTPSCRTQQQWNLMAPAFYPSIGSHSFVTPVAVSPGQWRPVSDYRTLEKGLVFSSPVVPNAWDSSPSLKVWENQDRNSKLNLSQAQQPPVCHMMRKKMHLIGQVLVLLRGVPGSGKSYLARMILEDNPGGVILSTDDYFYKCGKYHYDARCLGEAHEWNRKRAKEAFEMKISPIIIDNTNIQAWEMKPYVALAQQFKYKVMFREPDTWWKFKPKELERRNIHGVSKEKIKRMLEQYERCLTVNSILESSVPEKSEVTAWNEDACQEESHREREAHSQKENKPFASDLEPLNLPEDDKPLSSCSLISESNFAPESYQKEEKEMENNSVKHNTENNTIQDILDVDLSSYVEKELPLEKKEEKGERMEITETEMDETDIITTEETVCMHRGGVEKHSNDNILKVQTESEQNSEIGLESDSTERSNVVEPSASVMEASEKPELLNFLGDWPVQQTMGQRVKRTRRLEKSSLKSDREGKTPSQHPELGKEQAGLTDTCTVVKGQEGENTTSSCFPATSDKVAPDLQTVGHWPVSLEQRQQRSRRMRKTSLSQSDEGRNTEGDVNRSALDTVDVLRGIPMDTVEQDVEELHFHQPEMIGNETVAKKKTQQNKRTRKHHKLALTFTNNNLPHSKEEEQLSVPDSAEEKQDACSCKQISSHSQTESHDFALLWRLENKMLFPETVKVLHGRLDGFKPKDMDNASGSQEKIPYRVMYDKSTFVEESELIDIDETEKLNMLCKLFDSFSVEAVKDLYERCNKDINWATGLLLDSDEKLHNDVNTEWFQVKEAEPVVADFDFKENTNYDENRDGCTNTEQIIGASNVSDPSEDQNSSISTEESRVTKTIVADAGVSDSFTAVILNDSVELKNSSDTAPRGYAGSSAASVNESISGMQKMESESPVEEVMNKLSVSQVDVDLYVPVTLSQALKTTTNSKLTNESNSNSSESNVENAKGMPLLLDVDDAPLIDSRNDKELETDRENLRSSREISGKEESGTLSRNEDKAKTQSPSPVSSAAFDIDSLELTLPPELALQLKEIFGPVGIDAGSLTAEDCVVHIDLNLAKVIHEKWKESILKRQRRDESWKLSAEENKMQKKGMNWVSSSSNETQIKKAATSEVFPFMDHWNARTQKVSLRQIISEEIAMQEKEDLKRVPSVARKDCAAKLKEKQLFEMFPTINQNFLMDIFKDNNYSLEQTEQFLNCVLEADPVKTVIAQESVQRNEIASSYSAAKNREKARKAKEEDDVLSEIFQEYEYPQYDDFRAEAFHHQQKRQECLKKAGEAYHMGMKPVAAFYARQGRLHEQKMKEANHAAAARIFERVNTSLLPLNVLDLHGLHVDEAVNQLSRVLQEKSNEYQQSGGKPYLCVITGRGSHSQGGVARIKPAAIRYLTSHNFRFAEIKPGCLKVMLN
ncbi:NEDD4-binding protein 2 isoform X3 [Tympanuchus pallidicinctus]|uniref:NEDD4-binding protein 2 isoform X3 n=1 Tax=Tympanuchus pallidicinctus TaxID=109042 RepID=UPI002286D856|nr:NEDD4-binding protein 2 isoform X3 [Tympanuchus pallidicinctus]